MTTCKDCCNYKPDPTNPEVGYCSGHEVSGDMDASLCHIKVFTPRFLPEQDLAQPLTKRAEQ